MQLGSEQVHIGKSHNPQNRYVRNDAKFDCWEDSHRQRECRTDEQENANRSSMTIRQFVIVETKSRSAVGSIPDSLGAFASVESVQFEEESWQYGIALLRRRQRKIDHENGS